MKKCVWQSSWKKNNKKLFVCSREVNRKIWFFLLRAPKEKARGKALIYCELFFAITSIFASAKKNLYISHVDAHFWHDWLWILLRMMEVIRRKCDYSLFFIFVYDFFTTDFDGIWNGVWGNFQKKLLQQILVWILIFMI